MCICVESVQGRSDGSDSDARLHKLQLVGFIYVYELSFEVEDFRLSCIGRVCS